MNFSFKSSHRKMRLRFRWGFACIIATLSLIMALHPVMVHAQQTEREPLCYGVTDGLGNQAGADTLVTLNVLNGNTEVIGGTNTLNIEAIAFSPDGRTLYAADAGTLGTLDLESGAFTAIGAFGSGNGTAATVEMTDVDSLTYDLTTDTLFGVHRRPNAPTDLLFKIDPVTGSIISGGFGATDYVEISITTAGDDDIDDIAADPFTGILYAVANSGGEGGTLISIDKETGAITEIGPLGSDDIEGLGFLSDGTSATLYGSTGDNGPDQAANNKLFEIDKESGQTTLINPFDETTRLRDYESLDCTIPAGLGDYVWEDTNQDGLQGANEAAIPNVTVNLWTDDDGDGVPDTEIAQTTTNADGLYEFLGLDPTVDYFVQFIAPAGRTFTQQEAGADNTIDSNADPAIGITALIDLAPGEFNPTIDAGLLPPLGSIGDTITCADTGLGIAGVTVTLTDASSNDSVTQTNADGTYLFDNLSAGEYIVTVDTSTLPNTCNRLSIDPDGGNDNRSSVTLTEGENNLAQDFEYVAPLLGSIGDSITCADTGAGIESVLITLTDADGNELVTQTDANGAYLFEDLLAGEYTVAVDTDSLPDTCKNLASDPDGGDDSISTVILGEGEENLDQDFAYLPPELGSIGGAITNEADPTINVEGIEVVLTDADGNELVTQTDANGAYLFEDLPAGEYLVQINDDTLPSSCAIPDDPNEDPINSEIILGEGEDFLGNNFACVPTPAALGDYVWEDTNENGLQDAGEPPVENVTVNLWTDDDGDGEPDTRIDTTVTDADGAYFFPDLDSVTPSVVDYIVQFVVPDGREFTIQDAGDDAADSDVDPQSGLTAIIQLNSGETDLTVDAGLLPLDNPTPTPSGQDPTPTPIDPTPSGTTPTPVDPTPVDPTPVDPTPVDPTPSGQDPTPTPSGQDPTPTPSGQDPTPTPSGQDPTPTPSGQDPTPTPSGQDPTPTGPTPDPESGSIGGAITNEADPNINVEGIEVVLTDANGNSTTVTTDANGIYLFEDLPAGEYSIQINDSTLPPGCTVPDDPNNSVVIGEGESYLGNSFACASTLASLGNYVWEDSNENGLQDAGEPPVENVTVNLWTDDDGDGEPDTQIDTTVTDADGIYRFSGLDPEDPSDVNYIIQFIAPNGREFTIQDAGDDAADSDVDPQSGLTAVVQLDSGQNIDTIDAGFVPVDGATSTPSGPTPSGPTPPGPTPPGPTPSGQTPTPPGQTPVPPDLTSSLGDLVWLDANNNGTFEAGEPGIADVTLLLWTDDDGDGLPDTNTGLSTTTAADGTYRFTGLADGSYVIQIPLINFGPGRALEGLESSVGNDPAPDPDDNINNDDNGLLVNGVGIINLAVTLALNEEPTDDGDTNPSTNLTLDFGLFDPSAVQPTPTPTPDTSNLTGLGNSVFFDTDQDGIQDVDEVGVPGVTVILEKQNPDGSSTEAARATTDKNGEYLFPDLESGQYVVRFVLPVGYSPSPPNQGSDDVIDSDGVPNTDGTEAVTGPIQLSFGDSNKTIDQGIYQAAELGDRVFVDENQDGIQDVGEQGLPGVIVQLYKVNIDGSTTQASQDTTDTNGNYLFADLPPGEYQVLFKIPDGYMVSPVNAGTDAATDSNGIATDDGTEALTAPTTLDANENDLTVDLGIHLLDPTLVDIGDFVFLDVNANGIQEPGEFGIAGVTVVIEDINSTFTKATTTGQNGAYLFTGLPAGEYKVTFVTPSNHFPSPPNQGGDDAGDSDGIPNGDSSQSTTDRFTVDPSEMERTIDQGYYPLSTIGSRVWYDQSQDGIQNSGESGVPGVMVILEKQNPIDGTSSEAARTTTDSAGNYLFRAQQPGVYTIKFIIPDGYTLSPLNVGEDRTVDSDGIINGLEAVTEVTELGPGEINLTYDLGLFLPSGTAPAAIGDRVWYDTNQNGLQDTNEPGIQGLLVELYDEGGIEIANALTDEEGAYSFANLAPGTYSLRFVSQPGYIPSPQDAGDDSVDSDADPLTGLTPQRLLAAGQLISDLDAGFYAEQQPPSSISNIVWYDDNTNGIQDEIMNLAGIPGITVYLFTADGVLLQRRITGTDGTYSFNNIPPGDYYLEFELPFGYNFSPQDADANDAIDSDVNPLTGRTAVTTLEPGENDPSWDAGAFIGVTGEAQIPSGIGSRIWDDENRNGIQDQGEGGVPGVPIRLYTADGTLFASTVSDATGGYLFANIPKGSYYLEFDVPNSFSFSPQGVSGNSATDSNVNPATGRTEIITLELGEINIQLDAGIFQTPGSLIPPDQESEMKFMFLPVVNQ